MTRIEQGQHLLKMIEAVDENDTDTLDEIDARFWCFLNKQRYHSHTRATVCITTTYYRRYSNGKRDDTRSYTYGAYTRSLDALHDVMPGGWILVFNGLGVLGDNPKGVHAKLYYGIHYCVRSPHLETIHLAWLHSIVQAYIYMEETMTHDFEGALSDNEAKEISEYLEDRFKKYEDSDISEALESLKSLAMQPSCSASGIIVINSYVEAIRAALEQGQRAQQIVDLMEQGKDIAFVSENHGEFIYRTQHSLTTQQDRDAVRRLSDVLKQIKSEIIDQNGVEYYEEEFPYIEDALTAHAESIERAGE